LYNVDTRSFTRLLIYTENNFIAALPVVVAFSQNFL
jgi:hypothetical protein